MVAPRNRATSATSRASSTPGGRNESASRWTPWTRQAKFATTNALDYPLLADVGGKVAALYGVKRGVDLLRVRRATFVIGTDQRIIEKISSEFAMQVHADRALAALDSRA